MVYVYRDTNGRWVGRVNITVDGKPMTEIGDREYSWCQIDPGEHVFGAEWGVMDKPMFEEGRFESKTLSLKVEQDKAYYICYYIQNDVKPPGLLEAHGGLLGKVLSKSHVEYVSFSTEGESWAVARMGSCNFRESHLGK